MMRTLTRRRREIAKLAMRGLRDREIAQRLGIHEGTVTVLLHKVYQQLRVRSRVELILKHQRKAER
jgi:two-component system nitrate/nitrite response regulator NarP